MSDQKLDQGKIDPRKDIESSTKLPELPKVKIPLQLPEQIGKDDKLKLADERLRQIRIDQEHREEFVAQQNMLQVAALSKKTDPDHEDAKEDLNEDEEELVRLERLAERERAVREMRRRMLLRKRAELQRKRAEYKAKLKKPKLFPKLLNKLSFKK
jgi:hypothetical protein